MPGGYQDIDINDTIVRFDEQEYEDFRKMGAVGYSVMRPERPFFKKTNLEYGPTWQQKKAFVSKLINDSNVDPSSKTQMRENFKLIPKYQIRGFKYGLFVSTIFFFLPVIRKQYFLRRFAISMIPMAVFLKYGYTWGHHMWWRKTYSLVATWEIAGGTRSRFTGK